MAVIRQSERERNGTAVLDRKDQDESGRAEVRRGDVGERGLDEEAGVCAAGRNTSPQTWGMSSRPIEPRNAIRLSTNVSYASVGMSVAWTAAEGALIPASTSASFGGDAGSKNFYRVDEVYSTPPLPSGLICP